MFHSCFNIFVAFSKSKCYRPGCQLPGSLLIHDLGRRVCHNHWDEFAHYEFLHLNDVPAVLRYFRLGNAEAYLFKSHLWQLHALTRQVSTCDIDCFPDDFTCNLHGAILIEHSLQSVYTAQLLINSPQTIISQETFQVSWTMNSGQVVLTWFGVGDLREPFGPP